MTVQQRNIPDTTYSIVAGNSDSLAISAISWSAILAGATAATALSMVLLLLGTALGLSAISPWSSQGIGIAAFSIGTLIWFMVMQLIASGVGGFITGRLRTYWPNTAADELLFRDAAHGFLAWALASLLISTVLGAAAGSLIGGGLNAGVAAADAAGAIVGQVASDSQAGAAKPRLADRYIDALFATDGGAAIAVPPDLLAALAAAIGGGELGTDQHAAVIDLIARRRGIDAVAAEQHLVEVMAQVKASFADLDGVARSTADSARKGIAELALWLFVSLLLGAVVASVAAVQGGRRRDP